MGAGRFEFQIVHDYGLPTQKVYYVNRAECTVCHQGGMPIFPESTWAETNNDENGSEFINRRLLLAMGKQKDPAPSYHGVNIRFGTARFDEIRLRAYDIDDRVNLGSGLIHYQKMWADVCGPDDAVGFLCRRHLVMNLLTFIKDTEYEVFRGDRWEPTPAFAAYYKENKSKYFANGFKLANHRLPDMTPFRDLPVDSLEVDKYLQPLDKKDNPKTSRYFERNFEDKEKEVFPFIVRWSNMAASSLNAAELSFVRTSYNTLEAALDKVYARSVKDSAGLFGTNGLSVAKLVDELRKEVGVNGAGFRPAVARPLPKPELEPSKFKRAKDITDSHLAVFFEYCGGCHASGKIQPAFLKGTQQQIWDQIAQLNNQGKILPLIEWSSDKVPDEVMPPADDEENFTAFKNNPDHRDMMINAIRRL